jgi:hypothetical protein
MQRIGSRGTSRHSRRQLSFSLVPTHPYLCSRANRLVASSADKPSSGKRNVPGSDIFAVRRARQRE